MVLRAACHWQAALVILAGARDSGYKNNGVSIWRALVMRGVRGGDADARRWQEMLVFLWAAWHAQSFVSCIVV